MGKMVPKFQTCQSHWTGAGGLGQISEATHPLRTTPVSPEDAQDSWAEEALDSSFLGSGEELDLLSEILDSLSTGDTKTGSLRPSQSLDCCHRGDLDSCLSLVSPQSSPTCPLLASPSPV